MKPDNVQCMHLSGGDGFGTMADGKELYLFSFADLTGIPEEDAMTAGDQPFLQVIAVFLPGTRILFRHGWTDDHLGLFTVTTTGEPTLHQIH